MSTSDLQSALKTVLKKSASDAAFRAKALRDPTAALKEAGAELPAGQKIKFVEKIDEIVIPLPPSSVKDAELSDDILEKAAGGAGTNDTLPPCSEYNCGTSVSWIM